MCNGTKIEIIPPPPPPPPPKSKSSSKSKSKPSSTSSKATKPAFPKANFNKSGYCIKHHDIQLATPKKDENNQLIYEELKPSCPSCLKGSHINKKSTSLGGGKVRTGRVHGYDPSRSRGKSREQQRSTSTSGEQRTGGRSQSRGRDKSLSRSQSRSQSIGRSKSRERKKYNRTDSSNTGSAKPRKKYEYDTPFDTKGRCHYHKNVQLASRKMTGGWKVLQAACPKCMEDKCDDDHDDSTPITSVVKAVSNSKNSSGGTAIQVAKRFSSRWKLTRPPSSSSECDDKGTDVGISDSVSVYSKKSTISTLSRQSTRSVKSNASSTRSGTSGKASSSGRYGEMPFDGDGYCCRHPSVQIAQKKMMGGFKILRECPDCAHEDGSRSARKKKAPRRQSSKSGGSRKKKDCGELV